MRALIVTMALALAAPALAEVRAIDGDTMEMDGITYRLNGIDAPEFGQTCKRGAGTWACGAEALEKLAALTKGAAITCEAHGNDPYGRVIATCYADGRDLGGAMTEAGYAWAFVKYSDAYVDQETRAKALGLGIWDGEAEPAWAFRAARWEAAAEASPDGCPIKGNISENGKIYHPPWSPWYTRTRISLSKGERWFCDEAEAIDAGWRAPRWP